MGIFGSTDKSVGASSGIGPLEAAIESGKTFRVRVARNPKHGGFIFWTADGKRHEPGEELEISLEEHDAQAFALESLDDDLTSILEERRALKKERRLATLRAQREEQRQEQQLLGT